MIGVLWYQHSCFKLLTFETKLSWWQSEKKLFPPKSSDPFTNYTVFSNGTTKFFDKMWLNTSVKCTNHLQTKAYINGIESWLLQVDVLQDVRPKSNEPKYFYISCEIWCKSTLWKDETFTGIDWRSMEIVLSQDRSEGSLLRESKSIQYLFIYRFCFECEMLKTNDRVKLCQSVWYQTWPIALLCRLSYHQLRHY